MGITPTDNINNSADEESDFVTDPHAGGALDFGNLFSHNFSNITPIYRSTNGSAEIYTATRYGKRFLLKGLKEIYREDPVYLLGLLKEFEIGISLEHNNIRRTLELETDDNLGRVILMEYIDGQTLQQMLASGRFTHHSAISIATQIAEAMAYMHSKEVYHRDLKPNNILLSYRDNTVKIIDFNLADTQNFVVLKNPGGTKGYMAPEQQKPDASPSAAADIYSYGVIVNQIAEAARLPELMELGEICRNPDPAKRPQSAAEILLTLERYSHRTLTGRVLASKALTWILLATAVAITVFITLKTIYL